MEQKRGTPLREIAISMYLLSFHIVFCICKLFPLKRKVTFVTSFVDNTAYIYEEMQRKHIDIEIVFLYKQRCRSYFQQTGEKAIPFETKNVIDTLKGIYHLATSKYIIVDNYYGFLSTITCKKEVQCIQIWHAAGAVKQFGILDPSNQYRSQRAMERFKRVYAQFHKIVVGSDFFADIFKEAFLATDDSFLRTGIPRTDFFFDEQKKKSAIEKLQKANPILGKKKVILYAPTFRINELQQASIHLDIEMLREQLQDEYVLLVRFHPSVVNDMHLEDKYSGFVYDYSAYPSINDLLLITDVLISDYSSIPMEFALLQCKMIFYAYDYEVYKENGGFWEDYQTSMPGPIVATTAEVIAEVKSPIDTDRIKQFSQKWNEYSDGKASEKFIKAIWKDI